tara:strand:+ start:133103 stop:134125 length:1023 start_codon:yes stop_codon:yes gene_type:complete
MTVWLHDSKKRRMMQNVYLNSLKKYYTKSPLVLLDIGAADGIEPNWLPAQTYLKTIGYEPDDRAFSLLKNDKLHLFINEALYSTPKELSIHLTQKQNTSSIYKPNNKWLSHFPEAERYNVVDQATMTATTLDGSLKNNNVDQIDFIKVDVQGAELEILKGGDATLSKGIFGIEAEVAFTEVYEGQPLFSDVSNFLNSKGFQLFDLKRYFWKRTNEKNLGKIKGQIVFADSLFLKDISIFLEEIKTLTTEEQKSKVANAISICLLYGYFGYSLELLDMSKSIFDEKEYIQIKSDIISNGKTVNRPSFKGIGKIANLIRKIYQFIKPTHNGWADSDECLGNL